MSKLEQWVNSTPARRKAFEQEHLIGSVTEAIYSAMEDRGITKAMLAKKIKCSKSHITQMLSGSRNMTLRNLANLTIALGLRVEVTFKDLPAQKTE